MYLYLETEEEEYSMFKEGYSLTAQLVFELSAGEMFTVVLYGDEIFYNYNPGD